MPPRSPTTVCCTWAFDSRRWQGYAPRPDDIVISTYPKCGTTWMQRIVSILVLRSTAPLPVMDLSPWIDARFRPVEAVFEKLEAQTHRRFLKAHLPHDALPIHPEVRYIHVARDGRDAALSYHQHLMRLKPETLALMDAFGLEDPALGRPFPRLPADAAEYFHRWMTEGVGPGATDGLPLPSYFDFQRSWWEARTQENVLMVSYADLKADLEGEMRRVAAFLGIEVPEPDWPGYVAAAGFEAMKKIGAGLLGQMGQVFADGGAGFINKGESGRWKGLFRPEDLALYDAALARLPADCARWLAQGRLGRGGAEAPGA